MKRPQIKIEADRKRDGWTYQRRGTEAEWAALTTPLGEGEIGYATDSNTIKVGDGTSLWGALPSISGGGGGGSGGFMFDDGNASGDGEDFDLDDEGA